MTRLQSLAFLVHVRREIEEEKMKKKKMKKKKERPRSEKRGLTHPHKIRPRDQIVLNRVLD